MRIKRLKRRAWPALTRWWGESQFQRWSEVGAYANGSYQLDVPLLSSSIKKQDAARHSSYFRESSTFLLAIKYQCNTDIQVVNKYE